MARPRRDAPGVRAHAGATQRAAGPRHPRRRRVARCLGRRAGAPRCSTHGRPRPRDCPAGTALRRACRRARTGGRRRADLPPAVGCRRRARAGGRAARTPGARPRAPLHGARPASGRPRPGARGSRPPAVRVAGPAAPGRARAAAGRARGDRRGARNATGDAPRRRPWW